MKLKVLIIFVVFIGLVVFDELATTLQPLKSDSARRGLRNTPSSEPRVEAQQEAITMMRLPRRAWVQTAGKGALIAEPSRLRDTHFALKGQRGRASPLRI